MTTVTLKRGYRLPKLRQQLKQADGTPVPLTGASVRLLMGIPGKLRKCRGRGHHPGRRQRHR